MVRFACPRCKKVYQAENDAAGKKAKCSQCGVTIVIPNPAGGLAVGTSVPSAITRPDIPSADMDIYSLAQEPARQQSDSWDRPVFPDLSSPTSLRSVRSAYSRRRKGPSFALFAISGILLVAMAVGVTFWATRNLPRSQDAGVSPASSVSPSQHVVVSGDMFFTIENGDVKKAAGQTIHFTPITENLKDSFCPLVAKANLVNARTLHPSEEETRKTAAFDKKYGSLKTAGGENLPELLALALKTLQTGSSETVADSDGKFRLELAPGRYVV